jgi:hypothetical protein
VQLSHTLPRSVPYLLAERLAEAHQLFLYKRDEGGFEGWVDGFRADRGPRHLSHEASQKGSRHAAKLVLKRPRAGISKDARSGNCSVESFQLFFFRDRCHQLVYLIVKIASGFAPTSPS